MANQEQDKNKPKISTSADRSTGMETPAAGTSATRVKDEAPSASGTANTQAMSRGTETESVADTAKNLLDQAKDTAGQAYEAATEKAATKLDEKKSDLSGGLASVADTVRTVGRNLKSGDAQNAITGTTAKYTDAAAQKLDQVANYFERRNAREMVRDLEGYARQNPAMFIAAAAALGLLAARFLKSTTPRYNEQGRGGSRFNTETSGPSGSFDAGRSGREADSTRSTTPNPM
jgi:ElaB/YqjD/DUF883 family membrane-anchored ribosome-binding protein